MEKVFSSFTIATTIATCVRFVIGFGPLLAGCTSGGQTGDEDVLPQVPVPVSGGNQDTVCWTEGITPIELSSIGDQTAGGFSAGDVLRYAEGKFEERLQWNERPEVGDWDGAAAHDISISPHTDEPMMNIEITYEEGGLRYFPAPINPDGRVHCRGTLEIDVRVSLATNDRAFDEIVEATLIANGPTAADVRLAFHSASVVPFRPPSQEDVSTPPVHLLAGDLKISFPYHGYESFAYLWIELSLSELGINGRINAWMYSSPNDGAVSGNLRLFEDIGTIGKRCADNAHGFPLALDEPLPGKGETPNAEDVLDVLNDIQWVTVREDNTQEALALNFEYLNDSVCYQAGIMYGPNLRLSAILNIKAKIGGGQIDGRWPVAISVGMGINGEIESSLIHLAQDISIDALESDWGVTGLDTSGYDLFTIGLDLQAEVASGILSANGELIFQGFVQSKYADGDIVGHLIVEGTTE